MTLILVIASVAAGAMTVNAALPAVVRSSNAIVRSSDKVDDRIETQISIVFATGELDSLGVWQDQDADGKFDITLWVKNVGPSRILDVKALDVFVGRDGTLKRIPYVDDSGGSFPSWTYSLENGTEWKNAVTLKIQVHYTAAQASGTYLAKVITASGSYDEQYFSF